jgi:hypothetical protein
MEHPGDCTFLTKMSQPQTRPFEVTQQILTSDNAQIQRVVIIKMTLLELVRC